jgi:hypothetical protein
MRNGQLRYCRQSTIGAVHGANYDKIRRRTQSSNYEVDHTTQRILSQYIGRQWSI